MQLTLLRGWTQKQNTTGHGCTTIVPLCVLCRRTCPYTPYAQVLSGRSSYQSVSLYYSLKCTLQHNNSSTPTQNFYLHIPLQAQSVKWPWAAISYWTMKLSPISLPASINEPQSIMSSSWRMELLFVYSFFVLLLTIIICLQLLGRYLNHYYAVYVCESVRERLLWNCTGKLKCHRLWYRQ